MRRQRQRLELKCNEPHNTWSQWKLEEARDGSANTLMLNSYTLEL